MERAKTKELEATEQGTRMVQAAKEEADKKVEAADKRAENAEQARAHLQVLQRGILNEAEAARSRSKNSRSKSPSRHRS